MKVMEESEVQDLIIQFQQAESDPQTREEKLKEVYASLETDLQLIGATVVEDRLQDEVPETLQALMKGDIKVWMLTGDKLETAQSIGFSCKLLTTEMDIVLCSNLQDLQREFNE